jgi:DNA polymerase-3 subunit delta'
LVKYFTWQRAHRDWQWPATRDQRPAAPIPYIPVVPLVPLHGHHILRDRLRQHAIAGTLPASLLLQGPRGVGKQRLALWLGQTLICERSNPPCGACQHCRYAGQLAHPDLQWFFPRPRLKDSDVTPAEILADYGDARAERAKNNGLYAAPQGTEAIYVATVRAIVGQAAVSPALARRKVFVIGDAERMVPQEGTEQAANALLKLLEEPPADTTLILTSSEAGALLPTIRSRVVTLRVGPMSDADVRSFVTDPLVKSALDATRAPQDVAQRVALAAGAPGNLFGDDDRAAATLAAQRMLDAALSSDRSRVARAAFIQGSSRARGAFSESLDALTALLAQRAREAAARRDESTAAGASRAVDAVERAKERAAGNVNPQLVTAALLHELATELT